MPRKEQPRLCLDYISEKLSDAYPQVSSLVKDLRKKHKETIKSVKHHRQFIGHNPLDQNHQREIKAVGGLFDDLEKIIMKMGEYIGHGFTEDSLYKDYDDRLNRINTEEVANQSAQKLFEAIMDYSKKNVGVKNTLYDHHSD